MWFLLSLIPSLVLAAALPQTSDVVLLYETGDDAQQAKYNYLFTVAGDQTIYPCSANRCSLEPFRDQTAITLTIYKLPDGYPRVATIVDQTTLAEYQAAAEQTYTIPDVATQPANAAETGRTFQVIQLKADGDFELSTTTQAKNIQLTEETPIETPQRRWLWPVMLVAGGLVIVAGGYWLWKRKF